MVVKTIVQLGIKYLLRPRNTGLPGYVSVSCGCWLRCVGMCLRLRGRMQCIAGSTSTTIPTMHLGCILNSWP